MVVKVGDKVRSLVTEMDVVAGNDYCVIDVYGSTVHVTDAVGDRYPLEAGEWKHLTADEVTDNDKPPFKVGDRVRLLTNNDGFGAVGALGTVERSDGGGKDCLVRFDDLFRGDHYWYAEWEDLELAPAILQIEAGKYYRTRDGRKVGPMEREASYWRAPGMRDTYFNDGRQWRKHETQHDLIAEWVNGPEVEIEETTNDDTLPVAHQQEAEPRRFKVGDKVRALVNYCWVKAGTEYIVNFLDCDGDVWLKNVDGENAYMTDSELELITPVEEVQKPDSHNGDEAIKPTLLRTKQGYGFEIARHGDYVWVDTGQKAPIVLKAADVQAAA